MTAMSETRRILVTGTMRSGTTFVGNVLAQSRDLFYLHEPFNPTWGIEGVDQWFPYVRDHTSPYANLVDQFFGLDFAYRSPVNEHTLRGKIKKIVGGKEAWRAVFYRYVGQYFSGMLIKDPLAALLSRYMYKNHNTAVVVLVRHPVAFYYSKKRLGWDFNLDNLRKQPHLLEDHLQEEAALLERDDWTYLERIALLWRCINKVLHNYDKEFSNERIWILKRHEDICVQPFEEFVEVFGRLGVEFSSTVRHYLRKSTNRGNTTSAPNNEAHQHRRNSEALAYYWKQRITAEERDRIRSVVEPVVAEFYDEESWRL